jgi:hypothetical protein
MKRNILFFALGVVSMMMMSSTNLPSILTFKPATPVSTVAYKGSSPQTFTAKWAKEGYQVKSSAASGYYHTYVVMEKYDR